MSFQTFFAGLDAEVKYLLGIATAAAPLITPGSPQTAITLAAVNEAIAIASPVLRQVASQADGATLTPDQVAAHAQELLTASVSLGAASGAITADKAAKIQSQIATIVAVAAAANAPVTP